MEDIINKLLSFLLSYANRVLIPAHFIIERHFEGKKKFKKQDVYDESVAGAHTEMMIEPSSISYAY